MHRGHAMLSAEMHRGNHEAIREGSYGRFLYNFYRTYDPNTGRYLESDPLATSVLTRPLGVSTIGSGRLNTYTYAWNSPLMLIDPLGADPSNPNAFMSPSTSAAFKRNAKAINKALKAGQPPPGVAVYGCNLAFAGCVLDAESSPSPLCQRS